jgi:hypothetical protein
MINILVPIPLMIIGISLTTFQKSQKQILATLTYTYFILNLALLILSLLYRVFFAGHAFFLIGNVTVPQVVGAFRRPTYLSWAAANVLLCAIVSLMTMHRSSFSKNKKVLWYFIFIVASYFLLASKIRGSLFAVIIASIIFFASKGITKALYLALILSLVFGLIFIFASNQIYSVLRIEDNASYIDWYNFTSGRLSIFERSIREIEANPAILIIGQPDRGEVYMSGLQDYRSEDWHDPLWMFHEFGLIGVFFFYGLLISLIIQIFKKSKRAVINRNNIWTVEIPLVLIIRNVITSLADSNLVIGHMDHIFFWICIGILICKPDDLKIYSIKRNTANPAVTIGKTSINNIVS